MKIMINYKTKLHFFVNRLIFGAGHLIIKNPFDFFLAAPFETHLDKCEMP